MTVSEISKSVMNNSMCDRGPLEVTSDQAGVARPDNSTGWKKANGKGWFQFHFANVVPQHELCESGAEHPLTS